MSFVPDSNQKAEDRANPKSDDSMTVAKPLSAKPITQDEDFCAELMDGTMDFSDIENGTFLVAVNTDDRNKPPLLASTMRGPFEFYEMVEAIGCMWEREQHHAMVYVLTRDFDKSSQFLDMGTIDFIEANWEEMVANGILEAALWDDEEELLIPVGLIDSDPEDD